MFMKPQPPLVEESLGRFDGRNVLDVVCARQTLSTHFISPRTTAAPLGSYTSIQASSSLSTLPRQLQLLLQVGPFPQHLHRARPRCQIEINQDNIATAIQPLTNVACLQFTVFDSHSMQQSVCSFNWDTGVSSVLSLKSAHIQFGCRELQSSETAGPTRSRTHNQAVPSSPPSSAHQRP